MAQDLTDAQWEWEFSSRCSRNFPGGLTVAGAPDAVRARC